MDSTRLTAIAAALGVAGASLLVARLVRAGRMARLPDPAESYAPPRGERGRWYGAHAVGLAIGGAAGLALFALPAAEPAGPLRFSIYDGRCGGWGRSSSR
jgi:hypothetical protein